jgi:uncharacterized protein YbaR (Trm112 family)
MYKRGVIYLDENECPKCRGKLVMVSVEKSITPINKDGIPMITQDIDDEIEVCLTCKKCGETYDVERRGLYFGIKRELPIINNHTLEEFNPFSI